MSDGDLPRPKRWRYPYLLTEHVFDKVRSLDLTLGEFEVLLNGEAEVIEETRLAEGVKELVLAVHFRHPLHVVIVVDEVHREERVVTVYEPDPSRWSPDFRRRR